MTEAELARALQINAPSPLHRLEIAHSRQVWCKRDDLLHPIISGNKWRKLKPILANLINCNVRHIGSFGGAYSNHIHALAFACNKLNIPFTACLRAHPDSPATPMIADIKSWGARLHYLSREDYKRRASPNFIADLSSNLHIDCMVPEGGSDAKSLGGVGEIFDELLAQHSSEFDLIVLPVASGGTMTGLINYVAKHKLNTKIMGVAVLKGEGYLEETVKHLLKQSGLRTNTYKRVSWKIKHDPTVHCGGYAKRSESLMQFQRAFLKEHKFALDNVYNAKSFYALNQYLINGSIDRQQNIAILNTGGLQGNREKTEE